MSPTNVVIELSPTRIALTTIRGRSVESFVESRLEHLGISEFTPADFTKLRPVLDALRQEAAPSGGRALVIISGPGVGSAIHSSPNSLPPGAAVQAARLALESLAETPIAETPHAVVPIRRDRATQIAERQAQTYVISFYAANQLIRSIESLLQATGLSLAGVVPAEALRLANAVSVDPAQLTPPAAGSVLATLLLDRDGSVLTATQAGQLLLVRPIALGLEAIIDAMMRPIKVAPDATPISLTREQAEVLLRSTGIPRPDQVLDHNPPLRGSMVLPLLQPVLQRIAIETKQSLRFGMSESERASATLSIRCDDGNIPRLNEVLTSHIGIAPSPTIERTAQNSLNPAITAITSVLARHALASIEQQQGAFRVRLRYAAAVGAAMALASVSMDAISTRGALASAERQLSATTSAARQADRNAAAREAAIQARIEIDRVSARVREAMAEQTDWPAFLAFLAGALPADIKLSQISGQTSQEGVQIRIAGRVASTPKTPPSEVVGKAIDQLTACPLVASVTLGSTSRGQVDGTDMLHFELLAKLITAPSTRTVAEPRKGPALAATPETQQ